MPAKPQPMAGQPDAADDLIAELAKLMAQDAQGDKPAAPAAKPAFSVRIPGEPQAAAPAAAPAPRFEFSATTEPAPKPVTPVPAPSAGPAPKPAEPEQPEPFRFDFDLNSARRPSSPVPVPPAQPAPVEATPSPVAPAAAAAQAEEHDSIADLIAAELAIAPAPEAQRPAARADTWTPAPVAANTGSSERQEPRAEVPAAPARPEQDRFGVPPVFGLATAPKPVEAAPAVTLHAVPRSEPAASAPETVRSIPATPVAPAPAKTADDRVGMDPIDEIESLIGRAMRVEFDKPDEEAAAALGAEVAAPAEKPAPSPALRSLATPTVPQPQPETAAPRQLSPADEAIMAAAQASGAEIGWVEAPEVSDEVPPRHRAPRSFGMSRALAGPLVAVVLLLAAGFGLYWVLGLGRDQGPAPLLTAEAAPVKETPAAQPAAEAAQQSVVFNEMAGVVPGAEEQLVSRDQADVNEVTQVPPADFSEEGLANRKVRTVTVRPDGTIVSGEDSLAGSAILPVDRPNVPEVPGVADEGSTLLASTEPAAAAAATPVPAEATTPAPEPVAEPGPEPEVTPVEPGSTVSVVDASGNPVPGKTAPVPVLKPTFSAAALSAAAAQATSPVNAVVDTPVTAPAVQTGLQSLPPPPGASQAATQPAAQPAAEPAAQPQQTAATGGAPAYVQLSSQRTEEDARTTAQDIANRFGPLFNGANLEVQRVDLGDRGIFYRVRVPANSLQEANTLCTNVKAAGGDCFTM